MSKPIPEYVKAIREHWPQFKERAAEILPPHYYEALEDIATTEEESSDVWKNTDPRLSIDKRAGIVVVYPGLDYGLATEATVETKHAWSIWLNMPVTGKIEFVGPDDDWDEAWWWTYAPGSS